MHELTEKQGDADGDDQHLDDGKSNHPAVDETFPIRIHEEETEEHHRQRRRHAADHTDGLCQDVRELDIRQIEDDGKEAGTHARISQAAQAERLRITAAALDGLNDVREEEQIKRNEQDRHIDEGIFAVNAVNHRDAHEADVGKDDHDIDDTALGFRIAQDTRQKLSTNHEQGQHGHDDTEGVG